MTGLGSTDLFHANMIAREMVLSAGMGRKVRRERESMRWQGVRADEPRRHRTLHTPNITPRRHPRPTHKTLYITPQVGPLDLMKLHVTQQDTGSMLRTLEPREAGDEEFYYQATDMSTEQVRTGLDCFLD